MYKRQTYALEMALVAVADVTAFAVYMKFWFPNSPSWIWIVSVLLILLAINLAKVKAFGEMCIRDSTPAGHEAQWWRLAAFRRSPPGT